jgi:hypothetical protein
MLCSEITAVYCTNLSKQVNALIEKVQFLVLVLVVHTLTTRLFTFNSVQSFDGQVTVSVGIRGG